MSSTLAVPQPDRPLVLLVNLGTPEEPTPAAVRRFLREFLSDTRVVDLPPVLWRPVLEGVVLRVRPRRVARKYRSVWLPGGSPLAVHSRAQADGVRARLAADGVAAEVRVAATYGEPRLTSELTAAGPAPVLVLPLYPQWAGSTVGAVEDQVGRFVARSGRDDVRVLPSFPTVPAYIDALVAGLRAHWGRVGELDPTAGERLLLSFHGIPERHVRRGDPYADECRATAAAVERALGLPDGVVLTTFQSRFGPGRWLGPATIDTVRALGAAGSPRVDVLTPGFAADCLETLEEIALLNRDAFRAAGGGELHLVPWANDAEPWVDALAGIVARAVGGRDTAVDDR